MPFTRAAHWFPRSRVWLALGALGLTAMAIVGILHLKFDDVPQTLFRTNDEEFQLADQVAEQFGTNEVDCVLLVRSDRLFTGDGVRGLVSLVEDLRRVPQIASVSSLLDIQVFDERRVPRLLLPFTRKLGSRPTRLLPPADASPEEFARAREQALNHPLVANQMLSPDATTTLVVARMERADLPVTEMEAIVRQLQDVAEQHSASGLFEMQLTGLAPIRAEILGGVRRESERFVIVGAVLSCLMALALFRRMSAVVIVGGTAVLGAAWTMGSMGLAGEPMNVITTVLPMLVMVIGFTDAVHLLVHFRKERSEGLSRLAAAQASIRHLGLACLLASITTAIGFASLYAAQADVIQRFGLVCAGGALLTFVAVVVLVPLLCSTRLGDALQIRGSFDPAQKVVNWFAPLVQWVVSHPRRVVATSLALSAVLLVAALQLRPSTQINEAIPSHNAAYQALGEFERQFGGALTAQVLVQWPEDETLDSPDVLAAISDVQQLVEEHPRVNAPISVLNLLEALPAVGPELDSRVRFLKWVPDDPLHRFVRPDLHRAVVTMRLADLGSAVHNTTFEQLRAGLASIADRYPRLSFQLTGSEVLVSRNVNQMIVDLAASLGSAAGIIFVIMTLGFRCLRLGLISVLPNVFPLLAVGALLAVTGQPLQMTSVIVFSVCLGIAVNDTIHFIHRYQSELAVDNDVRAAIMRAFHAVGSAMITTTAVFLVGFASIMISEMPSSRMFASLACVAMLAALVGDLLILPALIACFGGRRSTSAEPSLESAGKTETMPAVCPEPVFATCQSR